MGVDSQWSGAKEELLLALRRNHIRSCCKVKLLFSKEELVLTKVKLVLTW